MIQSCAICLLVVLHREGRQMYFHRRYILECVRCVSTVVPLNGGKQPTEAIFHIYYLTDANLGWGWGGEGRAKLYVILLL